MFLAEDDVCLPWEELCAIVFEVGDIGTMDGVVVVGRGWSWMLGFAHSGGLVSRVVWLESWWLVLCVGASRAGAL